MVDSLSQYNINAGLGRSLRFENYIIVVGRDIINSDSTVLSGLC